MFITKITKDAPDNDFLIKSLMQF